MSKEDTISPIVSTEGIMLLCMIDAMKCQAVETADIIGSFLQSYYDKGYIHIKTEKDIVTLFNDIYLS